MITSKQILEGIAKAEKWYMDLMNKVQIDDLWERGDKIQDELEALDKAAGLELVPGKILRWGVADGYAQYMVLKVGKQETEIAHIPLMDAYSFVGVYKNSKGKLVCPTPVAQNSINL